MQSSIMQQEWFDTVSDPLHPRRWLHSKGYIYLYEDYTVGSLVEGHSKYMPGIIYSKLEEQRNFCMRECTRLQNPELIYQYQYHAI